MTTNLNTTAAAAQNIFAALASEYVTDHAAVAQRAIPYVLRNSGAAWGCGQACEWANRRNQEAMDTRTAARNARLDADPVVIGFEH